VLNRSLGIVGANVIESRGCGGWNVTGAVNGIDALADRARIETPPKKIEKCRI
jgi:hypothetical protein